MIKKILNVIKKIILAVLLIYEAQAFRSAPLSFLSEARECFRESARDICRQ